MNKLGLHANVWVAGWSKEECVRAIAKTAELGFDFIEALALDHTTIDVDFTAKQLEQNGIGIALALGLDDATDLSNGDPERTRAGERRLLDVISVARDLGAKNIQGNLYSAFQKYNELPTSAGVEASIASLRKVGEAAAQHGITLGMEVLNRYETNVINTASQGVEFCKRVGLPNVKVHLDCYHMNIEEGDIYQAIVSTGEYLGYFHTGDSHRGYLGSGSIDFSRVFRALAQIDYQGPITFESFSSDVTGQPLTGTLGIWRNLWSDGDDLCSHARNFTLAQMKAASKAVELGRTRLP